MITVMFSVLLFLVATLVGNLFLSFFINEHNHDKLVYISPTIGFSVLMILVVNGNAFLPISQIKYIVLGIIVISILINIKKYVETCKVTLRNRKFWIIECIASLFGGIPVLFEKGLVSITRTNNDLIYYLADMDWLTSHTYFEVPTFTPEIPYYYLTNNMYIHNSRLGFDALGCLFMNLFNLEGYQVYFALCLACVCSLILLTIYFAYSVIGIKERFLPYLAVLLIFSLNFYVLLGFQYGPQIFGIICLLGTVFGTILMCQDNKWVFFTAIMISGVVTAYSEFGYYIFIVYCFIFLGYIIYDRKDRKTKTTIVKFLLTGVAGLVICIPSVIKIINYYIYLLTVGKDSLNADGWIIVKKTEIFSDLFGLSFSPNTEVGFSFGLLGLVASFTIVLFMTFWGIRQLFGKVSFEKKIFILVCAIFMIMEFMFALIRFDYGEFKHLISIQPFIYIIFVWTMQDIFLQYKSNDKVRFVIMGIAIFVVLGNISQINDCFPASAYNVYTCELQELHNKVSQLDKDTVILIPDYYEADECHQLIYALKNQKVVANGNSYYYKEIEKNFLLANAIIIDKNIDTYREENPIVETERFAIYNLDYENKYFDNEKLNISLTDENFKLSPDCLKSHDKIYCISNEDGIKVYGPYIPIYKGKYNMKCLISILSNSENEEVGFFELFDANTGISLAKTELKSTDTVAEINNLELMEDYACIEIRIYLKAGVEAQMWNLEVTKE